jgi:hypothetical protein
VTRKTHAKEDTADESRDNGSNGNVRCCFGQVCASQEKARYNIGVVFSNRKMTVKLDLSLTGVGNE